MRGDRQKICIRLIDYVRRQFEYAVQPAFYLAAKVGTSKVKRVITVRAEQKWHKGNSTTHRFTLHFPVEQISQAHW